ncbi:MAG: hypothetical protein PHE50_06080 [Dehalococcoidales bacterium]|nr:hypothetical protein [Dehalococcoidales bacterium]
MPDEQYKWDDVTAKIVIDALNAKAPNPGPCPICGKRNWQLHPGFVFFSLSDTYGTTKFGGTGLPCISLNCSGCGNTQFLNILALGILPLLEKKAQEQKVG